jgi:hypothetical protein
MELRSRESGAVEESKHVVTAEFSDALTAADNDPLWDRWVDG